MPAERRTFTAARPVKTERTHEENQERYVNSFLFLFLILLGEKDRIADSW